MSMLCRSAHLLKGVQRAVTLERRIASEHDVQQHAARPKVCLDAVMAAQHLRSNIEWAANDLIANILR